MLYRSTKKRRYPNLRWLNSLGYTYLSAENFVFEPNIQRNYTGKSDRFYSRPDFDPHRHF